MSADLFDRLTAAPPASAARTDLDAAFAARPRLALLRDALSRAAKQLRPARWNEPAVFFFDPKRQAELEAVRPAPVDRFAELTALVTAEMSGLLAAVELRRVARATDGLSVAARTLAPHCPAAKELADLLAVPDDEVFLALSPADRTGVRLHLRGAADAAQLYRLLSTSASERVSSFQLYLPAALRPDGTLPAGLAGSDHWLWPTQPLSVVPRVSGERVVLVGPAVIRTGLDTEPRFPALAVEAEVVDTLNVFQTTDMLSRLCGHPIPVSPAVEVSAVSRAA